MEQKQTSFDKQLKIGEEGEHIITEFLLNKKVVVMPLYQFNAEKTPMLFSKNENIICPDLLCYGNKVFFVEVKSKHRWVRWHGGIETGFNYRHYTHYLNVEQTTNQNVYVIFRHTKEEPTGVYIVKLDYKPIRYWDGKTPSGKYIDKPFVFYPYEALKKIGEI